MRYFEKTQSFLGRTVRPKYQTKQTNYIKHKKQIQQNSGLFVIFKSLKPAYQV
ncbi:hypothetical protein TTHERM_00267850 (macronuclear) [Tetrahymena thermophila SB210]|uniref:Uncharacterized protein n=1 Tax=Tetrahymena thermophila (strain SB210) TaxID=312017 RepID=I7MIY7_TETTS|nr:hypothetical protein TTHERM_00267850 [Tetrahymena thermophila SB210]EAR95675.1 hypothetical protein TTHERM_00267850 [Tetrahymena thermophila SB210]|eukprot:XP_001015920.1 hypothetical protein TTHERM_00267850 [Tetrahymena thermophila SB210]